MLRKVLIPKGNSILNYIWIYTYKFDKAGWFTKCKARFIIKGDQRKRTNGANINATILAGENFKLLLIIITKFKLELC